jgi:hypothetical protein
VKRFLHPTSKHPRVATEDQIYSQHNNINNHIRETKTFFFFQTATQGGFPSISPPNGMCHKIRTTYAHGDTRLDIVHVACLTSVETGICPTGGVRTSKPEYVFIGRRYPQCVRAAQQGERRRGTKQCKVQYSKTSI